MAHHLLYIFILMSGPRKEGRIKNTETYGKSCGSTRFLKIYTKLHKEKKMKKSSGRRLKIEGGKLKRYVAMYTTIMTDRYEI